MSNHLLPAFPWALRQWRLDHYAIEQPGHMPHINVGYSGPSNPLEAKANPAVDQIAEFVLRACLCHGPLVDAGTAALSRLTGQCVGAPDEDVKRLGEALAAAQGPVPSGSVLAWTSAVTKPATAEWVLVNGVLDGEDQFGVYEGRWNGRVWESSRPCEVGGAGHNDGDGRRLYRVRGWMAKPEVPDLPVAEHGPRCSGCDNDTTEVTRDGVICTYCEASWMV